MTKSNKCDIETLMEVVLERTFEIVSDAYKCRKEPFEDKNGNVTYNALPNSNNQGSIVFPRYFHGSPATNSEFTRVTSEQELRFAFVQAFSELVGDYYYAVEVPTKGKYKFTNKDGNLDPKIDDSGRSGSFDLVIYNNELQRVCLVEFKANYPDKGCFSKDFLKLANPKEDICNIGIRSYFVHIVISYGIGKDKGKDKLQKRLEESSKAIKSIPKHTCVNYVLYSLCRDNTDDNQYIATDLSPTGEIGSNTKITGISLHWYDEQTKDIKS